MKITTITISYNNCYILQLDEETNVLIDTGSKLHKTKFYHALEENHIPLSSIKFIVITHVHADHTGLLRELLEKTKAVLIYNDKGKQRLEAGKNNLDVFVSDYLALILLKISSLFVETLQCFPNVVTEKYKNFDSQPLIENGIEFIKLNGHTSSDVGIKVGSDLFCGDVCMNTPLNHKYFPLLCENKFELMKSWEKIIYDNDIITIYPGHGKPFPKNNLKKDYQKWKNKGVLNLFSKKSD